VTSGVTSRMVNVFRMAFYIVDASAVPS
jgi:hypothetical protein